MRELANVLEYAALQAGAGELRLEHLPEDIRDAPATPASEGGRDVDERSEVVEALEREGWNRARAAAALGVSRVTLWKRMKRHGVSPPEGAGGAARREAVRRQAR